MNNKSSIDKLKNLLESSDFRFSNYQDIPKFLFDEFSQVKSINYQKKQVDLDAKRYEWLKKFLPKTVKKVCEIGSNIGFFSTSLARDFSFSVKAYEPNESYAKVSSIISSLAKLDKKLQTFNEGVNLKNISELDEHDLTISLNVLHHAGCAYDKEIFNNNKSWEEYAVKYLESLRKKSKFLFFQTGNMKKGKAIFSSNKTIHTLKNIFDKSGWKIISIGVIRNLETLNYESYSNKEISKIKLYNCRREKINNMVGYYFDQKLVSYLTTGLAQRPLWFCEKVDSK